VYIYILRISFFFAERVSSQVGNDFSRLRRRYFSAIDQRFSGREFHYAFWDDGVRYSNQKKNEKSGNRSSDRACSANFPKKPRRTATTDVVTRTRVHLNRPAARRGRGEAFRVTFFTKLDRNVDGELSRNRRANLFQSNSSSRHQFASQQSPIAHFPVSP